MRSPHVSPRLIALLTALVGAVSFATGCAVGSGSSQPTASTAAPTAAVPTAAPSPATSIQATPASASGPAKAVVLTLAPNASEARFRVREQLANRELPSDAIGRTKAVNGQVVLDPRGAILTDQSRIDVDVSTLQSDQAQRDNFIKRTTLQTSQFPTATFAPVEANGLPSPLPTDGQATFELTGDLTVHGVTRRVTWSTTAQFGPQQVTGSASIDFNFGDFGMQPPKAGPVLSVSEPGHLELDFTANRT